MKKELILMGWQEWLALPELEIPLIKAKLDTGAKTSSLHAYDIKRVRKGAKRFVRFNVHPLQADSKTTRSCIARLVDERYVMSSNGHRELRPVIETKICVGGFEWPIELTLSDRDPLRFRMLLGRQALAHHVLIDPSKQVCLRKYTKKELKRIYAE